MIALKSFLDGQGRFIRAGDTLPQDYDAPVLVHYVRLGLIDALPIAVPPVLPPEKPPTKTEKQGGKKHKAGPTPDMEVVAETGLPAPTPPGEATAPVEAGTPVDSEAPAATGPSGPDQADLTGK